MTVRDQAKWWGAFLVALMALLWVFGGVMTPFLAGMALAYFLDPVADRLERAGLSRMAATALIMIVAAVFTLLVLLLLIPPLVGQLVGFAQHAPEYVETLRAFVAKLRAEHLPQTAGPDNPLVAAIDSAMTSLRANLQTVGVTLAQRALSGGLAFIDFAVVFVIAPIVTAYMLNDWDRMIARLDDLLPRDHAADIRQIAGGIDRAMAGFVRGQISVCVALGAFYAIALSMAGLNFGLAIGLLAGALTFIPYVGFLVGGVLSMGIALAQYWGDWPQIALIAGIFFVGQALEGNILTPRWVGGSVGLHPVALMFALAAFGSLFGFAGLLIAVPTAAAIGVVIRFGLEKYKGGRLYRGAEPPA